MSDDDTTIIEDIPDDQIPTVDINDEISTAFLDYAMSVIVSRALPDVRDGLKPVQRRIVYSMFEEGMHYTSRHRKCANVVGNVMGRYHPHSNDAIYDALVRIGQDFNTRYQLIDPQGNFGTVDDPPAAMRYCVVGDTRVRLADGRTVRMDSLVPDAAPNSDTEIDVKLLDRHGNPVKARMFFHSGTHDVLELTTSEGFSLTGTENHPVLCLVPVAGVPMFQWKLLSELQPGDRVAILDEDAPSGGAPYVDEFLSAENHSAEALSVVVPIVEAGYFYATVAAVTPAGQAPVYSVRVESDDHAFLANGFVNHNTECRLSSLSKFLTEGINEDTVDFEPNYDGEYQQPSVLPSRFPNLLANGSTGIAVGMATNMPPHNLGEIIDAVEFALDNPDAPVEAYLDFVQGPDFPTGGLIVGRRGAQDALLTGRGSVKIRAVTEMEELPRGKTAIIVRELPYMVSQDRVLEKIAGLVNEKKITGISDLRNESSARVGTRLVIELKRDAIPQVVLNQLFKMTQLQDTFGVNNVALVDGVPRTLNIAEMIGYYVDHQMEVIERRTKFRLQKAKDRAHIVEGLLIALDNIDEVVKVIRASKDVETARMGLMERFGLSEIQAQHILNMPLRRLTALETDELRAEYQELMDLIAELEAILADPARRRAIISEELEGIRQKYGDERRSILIPDDGDMTLEDLIADDDLIVTVSTNGYLKSVKANVYRSQVRGGRGVKAAELREDDIVDTMIHTSSHQNLLFFTNKGQVHRIKAHQIPVQTRTGKGVVAQAVLPLEPDERIQALIDTKDFSEAKYLTTLTKKGVAKKTEFKEYDSRQTSIIAIRLQDDDEVVAVRATSGENEVLMFTKEGMGIRFPESDLRPMGRATQGVRGMRLREDDEVVAAASSNDGEEILLLTSGGYGKRTALEHFRAQKRGGIGVKAMKLTRVRGTLVGARAVSPDDEVFVINTSGVGIRTAVKQVSRQKREATGVRIMNLEGDDTIASFAVVQKDEE